MTSILEHPSHPTCGHKQDASAEQDVVLVAVDASDPDTQAAEHQQNSAEDGEEARCTDYTYSS